MRTESPFDEDRAAVVLLSAAVVLAILPHLASVPLDIATLTLAACVWRFGAARGTVRLPARGPLVFLAVLGAALVFAHFHRFHGQDAASALLLIGVGLKLLEMRTQRDLYVVVYLLIFVAVTLFLAVQNLWAALYGVLLVILLLACLLGSNGGEGLEWPDRLKLAGGIVAQSVPVMVVLFLLVPRISGPLWRLPQAEPAAGTGLGESMEPGAISRLGLSHETAFRVEFSGGEPPPPQERYWRGPVLWQFDGRRWTPGPTPLTEAPGQPNAESASGGSGAGIAYRYTVTLEPHQRRWVFALDRPASVPHALRVMADGLLLTAEPIRERQRYELVSRLPPIDEELGAGARLRGLRLPGEPSERIRQLVRGWRADAESDRALVTRAMRYFREEPFVYTLEPPAIAGDPIDGFLFGTRRGFCEHYAGAFVYLMRAAAIPARVVTGYQGGHWNRLGRFLEVQQADAHAWAEVWLAGLGWFRVDPTAAVAPERVEWDGAFATASEQDGRLVFENPVGAALDGSWSRFRALMLEAGLARAALDHAWHRWFLDYGADRQAQLLMRLGIGDAAGLAGTLALLLGGIGALLLVLPQRAGHRADRALAAWQRVARKLWRVGLRRGDAEGWSDFARRAGAACPEWAVPLDRFTSLFLAVRYGHARGRDDLARLERLASRFPKE